MKLDFSFEPFIAIANPFEGERYEKLKRSLLAIMLRQKDKLFQSSQSPDGEAWQALSTKAVRRKEAKNTKSNEEIQSLKEQNANFASHKILVDTGALKNSLTTLAGPYQVSPTGGNEVALGTNIPYAAIHNFGGVIEKKTSHQIGQTEKFYNVNVVIPARPFMGFGEEDNSQITEKIEAWLKKGGQK